MTRIIAGFAGSLALAVPKSGTRPTSDRVREAIFSALESRDALHGARVVDLYAGTGALGLEAASRGAASVTLVERASSAARACHENALRVRRNAPTGSEPHIEVVQKAAGSFLEASGDSWDVALLDPPYDVAEGELARTLEALAPRLTSGSVVLVERAAKSPEPMWPPRITPDRSRVYGDTSLWWAFVE